MKRHRATKPGIRSAAIVPTFLLTLGCFGLAALVTLQAQPGWWNSGGAVLTPVVVTNSGIVTTNYAPNDYAVANQGQLKQFTVAAVSELNARLTNSGGAGPALSNLVYGWQQDYATNGYATNTANPYRPYKPSDFQAINVGQLKYIASLVYGQLDQAGYAGLYPSWITQNTTTDNSAANLGQLKEVFNFDLTTTANAPANLTATAGGPGEIELSWTLPAVNNATSFTVEESTDGGLTWTVAATLTDVTSTSTTLTGLDPGSSYTFALSASNQAGSSTSSGSPPPPVTPKPSPRFAVICLDQNLPTTIVPVALTNRGSVAFDLFLYGGSGYLWHGGSTQAISIPIVSINNNDVLCATDPNADTTQDPAQHYFPRPETWANGNISEYTAAATPPNPFTLPSGFQMIPNPSGTATPFYIDDAGGIYAGASAGWIESTDPVNYSIQIGGNGYTGLYHFEQGSANAASTPALQEGKPNGIPTPTTAGQETQAVPTTKPHQPGPPIRIFTPAYRFQPLRPATA